MKSKYWSQHLQGVDSGFSLALSVQASLHFSAAFVSQERQVERKLAILLLLIT